MIFALIIPVYYNYLRMPTYKSISILLLFILLVSSCIDDGEILIKVGETTPPKVELCLLKNANHGHGVVYNLSYDTQKLLTTLEGFSDFDKITYENGLPVKAERSNDKSYYISFQYDAKGGLSLITFVGKDSAGKSFEFKSSVFVNTQKQVERINLSLPVFDDIIESTITYDKAGNVTKISIMKEGKSKTLLENLSFDDKNSPYLGVSHSNIMLYFIIYSASLGAENTTYFVNKNNVTLAKIYSSNGEVNYTYQYEYNDEKFPVKTKVTRRYSGKDENYQESFSYNCPK
ncbi:hypothetical protein [Emticicia sp. BO119]|uniref:hypothetical protein n=1 Tax=Emticicia sp. BO119 TaxID=2757768 RepID=UPI0015F0E850|nr:hypothetical protein [Emticicia sp. BO119]MBA4854095.1 hypothetical protein [Emticicia sp. BO119]